MGLWRILECIFDAANESGRKTLEEADRRGLPVRPDVRQQIEGYGNSNLKRTLEYNATREQREAMMRNHYRR